MTVNISRNALNSQAGASSPKPENSQHILNRLSSGISLPETEVKDNSNSKEPQDTSEVSKDAMNKNASLDSNIDNISSMQEAVNRLDTVQTAMESVSSNLWGIEESINSLQSAQTETTEPEPVNEVEAVDLSVDTSKFETQKEDVQNITNKYLEGIDHTGTELIDYLEEFISEYSLDINISTENLGKTEAGTSLASLAGEVDLLSEEATDILSQAQEEVASLQISTEMHRSNLLNDIGNEIARISIDTAETETEKGIEDSIQEVSEYLMNNPESISDASQINMPQAASLLLS